MRKLGSMSPFNGILLTLIFFLVTGCFAATQVALAESGSGVVTPSVSATETASNTPLPPSASTVQVKRSAHAEELHAARLAGDLAAVQALEASASIQPAVGENCGQPALRTSGAVCGSGEPQVTATSNRKAAAPSDGDRATFGADIKVRTSDYDTMEINPSMASDSDGNLYAAFQTDLSTTGYFYIQLYRSIDGGVTWDGYGFVLATDTHLLTPSIAIGEGTADTLLLAYIVDDGSSTPYPEVATAPLGSSTFTIQKRTVRQHLGRVCQAGHLDRCLRVSGLVCLSDLRRDL